jgi:predicted GNAT family acetyltransferase
MTTVRASVRVIADRDRPAIAELVAADPIGQCVFAARLEVSRGMSARHLGGQVWGVEEGRGLRGAVYAGGNLIPLGGSEPEMRLLGTYLSHQRRSWSSVVGRAEAVLPMWSAVGSSWGPARDVRANQPLMVIDRAPNVAPDPLVNQAIARQLPRYLPAALAMFTEELQLDPPPAGINSPYRTRIAQLIAAGLAFVRFDDDGHVMFKAEIAAVSSQCCQIQGVWVDPAWRGQGIGTAALATVIGHGLRIAPRVSLYVNDFNTPARRMYQRLGMTQVGTFATVLF